MAKDMDGSGSATDALTVSQAMQIAKRELESITVKIIGEVSEYSANARYKAVYFTIKDEGASLPCMMWKNRFEACGTQIQIGSLVELTGKFTLYAAKGRMNFDVFSIELAGEGKLRMQVANLAKKLQAEGLMEPSLKKTLPAFPERIGLVTSPRGAAVYDVLRTLRRRYPQAEVVFAGVGVEGSNAPREMSSALQAVQEAGVDVILLVRGGGSFEDLMPFNDEGLARTIFSLQTPIVTGIGHEPDTSIADMVSDLRASTPTAAAEAVAPASSEIDMTLKSKLDGISKLMTDRFAKTSMVLEGIAQKPVFSDPMRMFETEAHFLDDALQRISSALPKYMADFQLRLARDRTLLAAGLKGLTLKPANDAKGNALRLQAAGKKLLDPYKAQLSSRCASLDALSPLGVLERGYSITRNEEGKVLSSSKSISAGDGISVQMRDGTLGCIVETIKREEYAMEEINGK